MGTDIRRERHPILTTSCFSIILSEDFKSIKEKDPKEIFPEEDWCVPPFPLCPAERFV